MDLRGGVLGESETNFKGGSEPQGHFSQEDPNSLTLSPVTLTKKLEDQSPYKCPVFQSLEMLNAKLVYHSPFKPLSLDYE